MPLIFLGIAAIAGYFLLAHHPKDPPGGLVSDVKAGHDYVLFVYASTDDGHEENARSVSALVNSLGGIFRLRTVPTKMGDGVISFPDGSNHPAASWAVPVTATMAASAVTIDDNIKINGHDVFLYQALQAA